MKFVNKRKTFSCVFIYIFFSIISCKFISFENLSIKCNITEDINFFNEEYIILEFSLPPNPQDIEDSINLTNKNNSVICDFNWHENKCYIKPRENWRMGENYYFTLNNSISLKDGRIYDVNINRFFSYGQRDKYLKLISCSVYDNAVVKNNELITFKFNQPIDVLSFKDKFQLSPTISYKTEFLVNDTVVNVIPNGIWETNTYYTWEFESIKSKDQYPQEKKYYGSFYSTVDIEQPKLVATHPVLVDFNTKSWKREKSISDIFINESIGFIFSEPVDFDSVKNSITFVPSVSGNFVQYDKEGREFVYCIQKNWDANIEYQIKIANTLTDINNIPFYDEYTDFFIPQIDYITVDSIALNTTEITDFSEQTNICQLSHAQNDAEIDVVVNFSKNIDNKYKDIAYESINISSFFPSSAMTPTILSILWLSDSQLEIRCKGFTKSILSNNYYRLRITGGKNNILSEEGSYIKEDICVFFIVQ